MPVPGQGQGPQIAEAPEPESAGSGHGAGKSAEPGPEVSPREIVAIARSFDELTYPGITPVAGVLGVLVTMFTIGHIFLAEPNVATIMVPVDGATAVLLFAVAWLVHRRVLPTSWTHGIVATCGITATLNTGIEFLLQPDPVLTTTFMAILIAVGLVVFSKFWYFLVMFVVLATWFAAAQTVGFSDEIVRQTQGVLLFSALSALSFFGRRRGLIRVHALHLREAEQAALLRVSNRELTFQRDRAEAANRAKSQFLANMSHELRTPLNAIIGYAEMLEEDATEQGRRQDTADLGKIVGAGRHLLGLIDEVLDLSKIDAGHLRIATERVDIRDFLDSVLMLVQPLAEDKQLKLTHHIECRRDAYELDPARLRQCLVNLLSNACKFTDVGEVQLVLRDRVLRKGPGLAFEVRDTGIGVAPDQLTGIFEPFVQVDGPGSRRTGGTGLGLAISRRLARMMGGDVQAKSELGRGSSFTLTVRPGIAEPSTSPEAE